MSNPGGKGHAVRRTSNQKQYASEYERLFGQKKPEERQKKDSNR